MPRISKRRISSNTPSDNSIEFDSNNEPGPSHKERRRGSAKSTQRLSRGGTQRSEEDEELLTQNRTTQRGTQRSTQRSQFFSDDEPTTQSKHKNEQLSPEEEDRALGTLIKYLLAASSTKLPIKMADIKKSAIHGHVKYYKNLMDSVKVVLHEIFGYKLINIGSGKWIIVNALDRRQIRLETADARERTLLFIVLSHIFMLDGSCPEDNLFQLLRQLNIFDPNGPHQFFGNIVELITKKFVQQLYLIRNQIAEGENEVFEYSWGVRAKEELDPREVLEFMSMLFKKPVTHWTEQHRQAFMEYNN